MAGMRTLTLGAFVVGALALLACNSGGESTVKHASPPAEMQSYAAAMEDWWRQVARGSVPGVMFSPSRDIDAEPINSVSDGDGIPPVVEAPLAVRHAHELLVNSVFGWAAATSDASDQGLVAGVAAAFCNPSAIPTYGSLLGREAEALQLWRERGDPCDEGSRSADGRWRQAGVQPDFVRDYTWQCGGARKDKFGISTWPFERACQNEERWKRTLQAAVSLWATQLAFACAAHLGPEYLMIPPSAAEALAICRDGAPPRSSPTP